MPPTAGAAHMALALYRLTTNSQQISDLQAENLLYANTIRDLEALEGLLNGRTHTAWVHHPLGVLRRP